MKSHNSRPLDLKYGSVFFHHNILLIELLFYEGTHLIVYSDESNPPDSISMSRTFHLIKHVESNMSIKIHHVQNNFNLTIYIDGSNIIEFNTFELFAHFSNKFPLTKDPCSLYNILSTCILTKIRTYKIKKKKQNLSLFSK